MTLSVRTFDAECCYAEWSRYVTVILNAFMLSVIMLTFAMLIVILSLHLFWLTSSQNFLLSQLIS
jgi:hypothetical protein